MIYDKIKLKDNFKVMQSGEREICATSERNNELNSICCEMITCIIHNALACMKLKVHLINSEDWRRCDAMCLKNSSKSKMQMSADRAIKSIFYNHSHRTPS
jgi:hypothetical protein